MRWIEDFMNYLSDKDWAWWPYVSLRPEKHVIMDNKYVLRLTLYYSPVSGTFYVFFLFFLPENHFLGIEPRLLSYVVAYIFLMVMLFFGIRFTTALAWNSRARRLQKQKRKPEPVLE